MDTRSLRFQLLASDGSDGDDKLVLYVAFSTSTSSTISVAISTGATFKLASPPFGFNLIKRGREDGTG